MKKIDEIEKIEHLALFIDLELEAFCKRFNHILNLPPMDFDCENETEWGEVEHESVIYNVSRPYEKGTLHQWDDTVPELCNFGVSLCFLKNYDARETQEIVERTGHALSGEFRTTVFYHRTWYAMGKDEPKKMMFKSPEK